MVFEAAERDRLWPYAVIDCDVHANVPTLEALFPYLDDVWVHAARERGWKGTSTMMAYPSGAPTTARTEWRRDGSVPASELSMLQQDVLNVWQCEYAIVNCYYGVSALRHPDWAIALASAVNDWLIENWLEKDQRLRASIVIPARDPAAAAREINRVGGHPGFVQVLMPVRSEQLYGQRIFWPIYEALTQHDLVMGIHWGGHSEGAPSPTGWASWYAEEMAAEVQVYGAQLTSLIVEGVFQKFPALRVSMLEGGFAWFPSWGWTINKKWKGLRREFPWVNRLPTEIVRDHFRFSAVPADMGPIHHMKKIIQWLNSDDLLMFASDYPHMHDDDWKYLFSIMTEQQQKNMMSETARRWYRL